MNGSNESEREYNRITQIANEYRQNGYTVIIEPSIKELPNFLSDYKPDIIAKNNNESVIIEIISHSNILKESQLSRIAEIIESHPGWRFELVMTNPKGNTLISSEARLPKVEEVSKRLTKAKKLVSDTDYEVAIAIAWSALEGLLRLIGRSENITLERQSSTYVIKRLYSLGLVDSESYQELFKINKIRNSIVHGLVEPNLNSSEILGFIETVRKILTKYRRTLTMCKCPVCGKQTANVGTLFSHLINIRDEKHEKWLESYCKMNKINLGKLLVDRAQDKKDANKPLTDLLKRDFCEAS
ncbi:MAG: hypothetical protein PHU23_00445 [Dehalococcoidales bacterium]|nr:hypothetical protein [Dehalococcoidales bacterium]